MAEDAECDELLQQLMSAKQGSVTGGLILRLEKFLKKPTIEDGLSEVLLEYMQHLNKSKIYLSKGVFNINFAECALLLQCATNLYAKKVDLLWDCIIAYQERHVLYEERSETNETEFQRVEERKERFKRKRRKVEVIEPPVVQIVEPPPPRHDEIYDRICKYENDYTDDLYTRVKDEPASTFIDEPYHDYFSTWYTYDNVTGMLNRCPLMMKDINKIKNNPVFKRQSFYTRENKLFNIPIKGLNDDGDEETLFQYSELTMNYLYKNSEGDLAALRSRMDGTEVDHKPASAMEYCLQLFLSYYRIPMETIYEDTEKFLLFYKDFLSTLPPAVKVVPAELLEKASDAPEPVAEEPVAEAEAARTEEGESGCDIRSEDDSSKLNRQDPIRKTTESSDSGFFDADGECQGCSEMDKFSSAGSARIHSVNPTPVDPDFLNVPDTPNNDDSAVPSELQSPNVTVVEEEVIEMCKPARKRKTKDIDCVEKEKSIKLKRSRKQLFKTRPVHTVNLKKFECFFSANYKSAEDEGTVVPVEYCESEDDTDHFDQTIANETESFMDTTLETNEEAQPSKTIPVNEEAQTSTPVNEEGQLSTIAPVNKEGESSAPVSEGPATSKQPDDDEEDDSEERFYNYLNWKQFIEREIKTQAESQFNIHDEGTAIIERIGTVGKSMKYTDMCSGMSSRQVTHSFIAMLQLANTYNVEIGNATGGTLANDTLELKLLSKERQHENLGEYQAPSEVSLSDRLKNAKRAALNPTQDDTNAPKRTKHTSYDYPNSVAGTSAINPHDYRSSAAGTSAIKPHDYRNSVPGYSANKPHDYRNGVSGYSSNKPHDNRNSVAGSFSLNNRNSVAGTSSFVTYDIRNSVAGGSSFDAYDYQNSRPGTSRQATIQITHTSGNSQAASPRIYKKIRLR